MSDGQKTNDNELFIINKQGKIRVKLSYSASTVLKDDMLSFSFNEFNSFCNHVFNRYYKKASNTVSLRLEEAGNSYEKALKQAKRMRASTKKKLIECMLAEKSKEERIRLEKTWRNDTTQALNKADDGSSVLLYFSKENVAILTGELNEKKEYNFHNKAGGYIRDVLEEYASLSHINREAIVREQEIETINNCIGKGENRDIKGALLRIKIGSRTFNVIPYRIVPDPLNTRGYLVGYSFELGKTEDTKKPVSVSLGRLNNITVYKRKRYSLDAAEKKELDSMVSRNLTAFIVGGETKVKVKLTPEGERFYRNIITSRPAYESIEEDSDSGHKGDMIYTFNCSTKQIENYFFTFGDEAEILEPENLRRKFAARYKAAMNLYVKPEL